MSPREVGAAPFRLSPAAHGHSGTELALRFDEVLAAAGGRSGRCDRPGGQPVGHTLVPTRSVVGTVGRPGQFDIAFRPLSDRSRERFERIAAHLAAGGAMAPMRLLRTGGVSFVLDGHHRLAVARAGGWASVPATIQPVCTVAVVPFDLRDADLPLVAAERDFLRAVPLPDDAAACLRLAAPADYTLLAEIATQWCRLRARTPDRGTPDPQAAAAWWRQEVLPRSRPARGRAASAAASYLEAITT